MPENRGDIIYIGVGCLYFGSKPDKLDVWADEVGKSLNHLASVTDIEVEGDDSSGYVTIEDKALPINGRVSFTLEIPYDAQLELDPEDEIALDVETFRVVTFYEWDGPVTYVLTEPPAELADASTSVRIVRLYLAEMLRGKTGVVSYSSLGPSPFHADLSLSVKQSQSKRFVLKRTPSRGYDTFKFTAAKRFYPSVEDALPDFLEELSAELTVYYRLVAEYYSRIEVREEISELTSKLLDTYQRTGFKAWIIRVFTFATKMRKLSLRAIMELYSNQTEYASARRDVDEVYRTSFEPFFRDYLEGEMSQNFEHDLSAARDIASLLDQAREQQVQTVSLFLSALAGGLAGALVSLFIH